jgi:hypothetical protein
VVKVRVKFRVRFRFKIRFYDFMAVPASDYSGELPPEQDSW